MASSAQRALKLLAGVMTGCEFNTDRMAELAGRDFLTVTELADTLVRGEDCSFREAHHLVSRAVQALNGHYSPTAMAAATAELASGVLGRPLQLSAGQLEAALNPRRFVDLRTIPGGPGALDSAFAEAEAQYQDTRAWADAKERLLTGYMPAIRAACLARTMQ